MRYVVMVSHGKFAEGLGNALSMLVGRRDDVLTVGLEDGKSVDEFVAAFTDAVNNIGGDDEVVLLGDLIGGSPLTNAANVLNEKGLGAQTVIIGGMNLPLALTTVLMKDTLPLNGVAAAVLAEAHSALKEFKVAADDDDDI